MANTIYLDHAAATPTRKEVVDAMKPFLTKHFANPSSIHKAGEMAKDAVQDARNNIAKILNCKADEIIFTSSGSESINLAIQGVARASGKGHIITCAAEHAATLRCCEWLEAQGFKVTYIEPDKNGLITAKQVEEVIQENTILISLSYANNEVGTINPIKKIAKIANKYKIPFHVDACQAANYLSFDVKDLGVDLITINGSKMYGPKGVALLYIKKEVEIKPLIFGGKQEENLRAGTLNVPGIIGLAKVLELAKNEKTKESERLELLRDEFIEKVLSKFPDTYLNGHKTKRLPNNINISFLGIDAETLLLTLSSQGIYVSNGSACSAGTVKASHVLKAMGQDKYRAQSSIRFSLGKETTKEELDKVITILKRTISSLRKVLKDDNN